MGHAFTITLTAEIVIESCHQVERGFLFRRALTPCPLCHPVPKTTPRFPPVFMGMLRGHSRQPPGAVTLALAPALAISPPPFFWGGVVKELPGALDS